MRLRAQVAGTLNQAAPVGGGLLLVGLAAYVVLALAGHTLTHRDYAAAANMFLITAIVGPGVFAAVEQQTNREVSARLAVGERIAPSVRALALVAAALTGVICLGAVAAAPVLTHRVFAGHPGLVVATVVAVIGAAATYLLRGVFGGQRRYRWYGASLAGEGLGRLAACVVLVVAGWASADSFGFGFAAGCGVAAVLTMPGLPRGRRSRLWEALMRPTRDVRRPDSPAMGRAVLLLAGASVITLAMTNLGPVALSSRLPDTPADAAIKASFVSLFLLARIPLFVFGPVQAFLLPALAAAAARRDIAGLRARVRVALLAVLAVGLPGVLGAALIGPWAARLLFNAPVALPGALAAALGVGTLAMMAAQILQPALVALGRNAAATMSWLGAGVVFVALLFAAPVAPLAAVVIAQVVGPALVVVLMVATLRTAVRALTTTGEPPAAPPTHAAHPRRRGCQPGGQS